MDEIGEPDPFGALQRAIDRARYERMEAEAARLRLTVEEWERKFYPRGDEP